jgi:hypothetical protein
MNYKWFVRLQGVSNHYPPKLYLTPTGATAVALDASVSKNFFRRRQIVVLKNPGPNDIAMQCRVNRSQYQYGY